MTVKRTGLGRNLSALLKQADEGVKAPDTNMHTQALLMLPIEALKPGVYQPRGMMDEAALQALAASIEQQGILQPIVVRQCVDSAQYEIIAGERRWRASHLAKLTEVPVIVRDVNDETAMALALIENLQREALNIMDEARAMYRLTQEFSLTHQEVADLLSKSRAAVSNCLRLLQLSAPVMALLESEQLDMGHARCLLKLEPSEQVRAANLVVSRGLSVRETEAWVARLKINQSADKIAPAEKVDQQFAAALNQASACLGTKVRLKSSEAGRGRLLIDFESTAHLNQLLAVLNNTSREVVT